MRRVGGEVRGVVGRFGKTVQGGGDRVGTDVGSRRNRLALKPFGQDRSGRDGGGTTFAKKADFADETVGDLGGQLEEVAANGIGNLDFRRGMIHAAGIARVLEMIE